MRITTLFSLYFVHLKKDTGIMNMWLAQGEENLQGKWEHRDNKAGGNLADYHLC